MTSHEPDQCSMNRKFLKAPEGRVARSKRVMRSVVWLVEVKGPNGEWDTWDEVHEGGYFVTRTGAKRAVRAKGLPSVPLRYVKIKTITKIYG